MTVAPNQDGAFSLAVSPGGDAVFWMNSGQVLRCAADGNNGTTPRIIATHGNTATPSWPYKIAATLNYVFWAAQDGLAVCPAIGCANQQVTPNAFTDIIREVIRTDDGDVRVVTKVHGLVACLASDGTCSSDSICQASWGSLNSGWATTTGAFYGESENVGVIYTCQGTTKTGLANVGPPRFVRVVSDTVYAAKGQVGVYRCATVGCSGEASPIITGLTDISSMAVDATGVYWTSVGSATAPTGGLYRMNVDGTGSVATIAENLAQPTSLQLAEGYAYWVEQGISGQTGTGRIARVRL
jgi:hypothetical protein